MLLVNNNFKGLKVFYIQCIMTTSSLKTYICGCVRNCEIYLPEVLNNIKKIGELFDEYKIIIAYDKSDDKSLRILCDMKKNMFPSMEILINQKPIGPIRTQNIANARNQLLRYIREEDQEDYKYFIMIDMDDVSIGEMDTNVLDRFLQKERMNDPLEWDSLSFNRKFYYDLWALSIEPYVFSCWHFMNGQKVVNDMRKYIEMKLNEVKREDSKTEMLDCLSAFSGFAIYRKDKFAGVEYEWNVNKNIEIIPNELIKKNIQFVKDRIHNRQDDCEHRYFHIRASQLNGARIRISPEFLFLRKGT